MSSASSLKTLLSVDLRALALFRVGLGLLVIADAAGRWPDARSLYSDDGVLPGAFLTSGGGPLQLSLNLVNGSPLWATALMLAAAAAGLALVLGYRTRTATALAWILTISVQNRNPLVLNGGDVLLRSLLLWSLFLPLAAYRSIELALTEGSELNRTREARAPQLFSVGTVVLVLQIGLVYLVTAALKSGASWWPNGTASQEALRLAEIVTPFGAWLSQWTQLLHWSTYFVLGVEALTLPLLLFPFFVPQVRMGLIVVLGSMHLLFILAMKLGLFPWADLVALLALLPTSALDRVEAWLDAPRRPKLTLFYDAPCGFCKKMVVLLRTLLLPPSTQLATIQSEPKLAASFAADPSWVVQDGAGQLFRKWRAMVVVLRAMPLLGALFARLPLMQLALFGDKAYDFVAHHRGAFGWVTSRLLPWHPRLKERLPWPLQAVCLGLFLYVVSWNARWLRGIHFQPPASYLTLGHVLRLDQRWNMFAPYPLSHSRWLIAPGKLVNGQEVDARRLDLRPPTSQRPEDVGATYGAMRWRKFLMGLQEHDNARYRLGYGKWLCKEWNQQFSGAQRLATFQLVQMSIPTANLAQPAAQHVLWIHDCKILP